MGFSLSVATNIETDGQSQPADTMCSVYNSVRATIIDTRHPDYTVWVYFRDLIAHLLPILLTAEHGGE